MKLEVSNQQSLHPLNLPKIRRLTRRLLRNVSRLDPRWLDCELSLVLTDDEGITAVNKASFNKPRPTDVISFAYDPLPGAMHAHSGEVVVNVQRAFDEGPSRSGVDRELALYMAHGYHHLTGATDETPTQRARMLRREERWLRAAADYGHIEGLTTQGGG